MVVAEGTVRPAPGLRGWLARILIALLSSAVTLFLLEFTARSLQLTVPFFLYPSSANCMQRSSLLSIEFRPNCSGALSDTPLRTNSLGLRGPEVPADGAQRILAVGDSCTWGWRVKQENSYPAVLQQLLDERYGPGAYQVINAGFPGYTSYQGLRYLRDRGLLLHPSLVIASYGFNDLTRSGDVATLIETQRRLMPLLLLDDYLLDNSRMYRWLRWHLAGGAQPPVRAPRVTPDRYEIYMTTLVELAQAEGSRMMLLDFLKTQRHTQPYKSALADIAAAKRIPLITYDGPRLDIVHPTADGYRTLAGQIVDRLIANGDLP